MAFYLLSLYSFSILKYSSDPCIQNYGCFFFQAEDGIRDLVRSRGLGDVYKRQIGTWLHDDVFYSLATSEAIAEIFHFLLTVVGVTSVSYTHLTLPTSDLV